MENIELEEEKKSGFDIKRYLSKIKRNYYWFLLSVPLFITGAYYYVHYTLPVYEITTNVLIKQPTENANKLGSAFSNTGNVVGGAAQIASDVNNEVFKLKSVAVVAAVVDSLKLDIKLYKKGSTLNQPIDLTTFPVDVLLNRSGSNTNVSSSVYQLLLQKNSYELRSETIHAKGRYNEPLILQGDTLMFKLKDNVATPADGEYVFSYIPKKSAIINYISGLSISPVSKGGMGLLQVSLKDEIPDRAKTAIAIMVSVYDIQNLDYNNQALRKEMDFLRERLATAGAELDQQEKAVSSFKAGNQIYDVSASANQLLGSLPTIDTKKSDNMLKQDMLSLVESNIQTAGNKEEIIPNVSGLQNPQMADNINKYNQLVMQKRHVLENGTAQDPRLAGINSQMQQLRSNVLNNIRTVRNEIKVNESSLSNQEQKISSKFTNIPTKEKKLVELNRLLNIKESIYTFLLQKKEDKEIELASTQVANSIIIDDGLGGINQFPKPLNIYGIALGTGAALPALVIFIIVFLNKRLQTRHDVEVLTTLPIAGEISNVEIEESSLIVTPANVSSEAEQFRTLRTNIYYLTPGLKRKTLLITSGNSGEGKSFISANLANTMAIANKKVVLLEFDLRTVGLSEKMGVSKTIGLANYLMGDVEIEEIIQRTSNSNNLFFISSGYPLAPNPGELILSERMDELFEFLKANFDAIVIDTPPVGPVSDALTLAKWADVSFFVVRHKETLLTTFKLINKLYSEQKLPQLKIIINGITDNKDFNYGNNYGYGYGYNYNVKQKRKRKFILN
ncbi:polysaccharide biosynthesis tyrosine autokinase [Ilyomonas limi]|uniref:non-specific protein-tyrosine kinase n=1 Tax=Ilyomonas limi TaxID=2575867 RepID=A0A4U3KRX8_9BACT|nr:polysaccharide biosynthesis tyrosine autokinase [Ilyomonas limi]TKK65032.1 polysaccharide biosynthesis tyrosine autokinase [Ilyomonas limi]